MKRETEAGDVLLLHGSKVQNTHTNTTVQVEERARGIKNVT